MLVEGNDDKHVVWSLCKKHDVSHNFEVIDTEGIDNLFEQLPVRFKQSDIKVIGIIVDADENLSNRWARLYGILASHGFDLSTEFPEKGLIMLKDHLKVGIWIMPNNKTNGMLEDFISFLIPEDDQLLPVIKSVLDDIEEKKLNKYATAHRSKATIHSWLAIQKDPGTPMGLAITKSYLSSNSVISLSFIDWLSKLYNS